MGQYCGAVVHTTKLEILDLMRTGAPRISGSIAEELNRYPKIVDAALELLLKEESIEPLDDDIIKKLRDEYNITVGNPDNTFYIITATGIKNSK